MAEIRITQKVDDVDRSSPAESIRFSYGRDHFVIDLGPSNSALMEADFQRWIEHSRRIKPPYNRSPRSAARPDPGKVRAWAKRQGFDVSDKGRIPLEVETAYRQRHSRGEVTECSARS